MIGVFCRDDERETAQEFFQLFKTPWEFLTPANDYDVILSTRQDVPENNVQLMILYSSKSTRFDENNSIKVEAAIDTHIIDRNDLQLPIYRGLANLHSDLSPMIYTQPASKAAAVEIKESRRRIIRVGFDLFDEVTVLLSDGQPIENAFIPTLEVHVSMLRDWIVSSGIPLVEIPPIPSGFRFFACLTHDVDFVGIRRHKMDHTMWGFVYRALIGSLIVFLRGRIRLAKLLANWTAVIKLPFVFAGVVDDFWEHFEKYADVEQGLSSTFFLIPFKNRAGDKISHKGRYKRAARYDIGDVETQITSLMNLGFEMGLHGIDAWTNLDKASQEMKRIAEVIDQKEVGIRMHWLCYDRQSPFYLEHAGFMYDATLGYNETIGFRNGTLQVFQPIGVSKLLEIPLNIQDTALFFPGRLNLSDADAMRLCNQLMDDACTHGGVLTVSWHERSLEPERLWTDFYKWLLEELQIRGAWIGNAHQIVEWFRRRRSISLKDCQLKDDKFEINLMSEEPTSQPKMLLRLHLPAPSEKSLTTEYKDEIIDIPWNGETFLNISSPKRG